MTARVSSIAWNHLVEQHRLALLLLRDRKRLSEDQGKVVPIWEVEECLDRLETTWGIPCKHRLAVLIVRDQLLQREHLDPQWILPDPTQLQARASAREASAVALPLEAEMEPQGMRIHSPPYCGRRRDGARQIEQLPGTYGKGRKAPPKPKRDSTARLPTSLELKQGVARKKRPVSAQEKRKAALDRPTSKRRKRASSS